MRKAGIVPDQGTRARLPARDGLVEQHRLQAIRRCIDRCRQAGRPRAHNGDVTRLDFALDADAERAGQVRHARIHHCSAVVADHSRQARGVQTGLLEQAGSGLALDRIEAERKPNRVITPRS
jgi:hypothetical protein